MVRDAFSSEVSPGLDVLGRVSTDDYADAGSFARQNVSDPNLNF